LKNIAFIPVRGGSKSIPLKNVKSFCGHPLVYWTAKAAQDAPEIDEVIIATDSEDIKRVVMSFNFNKLKIYERSAENAIDTSSTESVMLEYLHNTQLEASDVFILIQATSPFLLASDVSKGLQQLKNSNSNSLLSCATVKRFFWSDSGQPLNYDFKNRPRRQDFDGTLIENGAFYINTVVHIKEFRNRLSGAIEIYKMPEYTMTEIDELDDWVYAEYLMKKHILSKKSFKSKIKLVISDVDGVLTDAGMYYSEKGDELKKFNTHDGMGFQLLREHGFKTAIITSEDTKIVERRAEKLKVDYLYQGKEFGGKLNAAKELCTKLNISLKEIAYIGDDINCLELLSACGFAACPKNATSRIKKIPNIIILNKSGGEGAFREFAEKILKEYN
jgi:YrbI family 3-deoxy-D-manno-octulosonate 8-phosphate phosphatase